MSEFAIAGRPIGTGHQVYVIAELSANHGGSLSKALDLVRVAAEAGADAVKIQTYKPETMTLKSGKPIEGTIWAGRTLFDLYAEAMTPWEWHGPIFEEAAKRGLHAFSSPFDFTAAEFLEELDVPAFKIASFELVDTPLIERVAQIGKPLILSTGMASPAEIDRAVEACGSTPFALLKCNSGYPAPTSEMNLMAIPLMADRYGVPIGLSDHTLSAAAAVASIALGAVILEKHLCLSREEPGPDSAFSLEPQEFAETVRLVRQAQEALGEAKIGPSPAEMASLPYRRSLWLVRDLEAGEILTSEHVASLRPWGGMAPSELSQVLGKRAKTRVEAGSALAWTQFS